MYLCGLLLDVQEFAKELEGQSLRMLVRLSGRTGSAVFTSRFRSALAR